MANIIHPLFPISGELQDVVFYQRNGKTHVRRKPVFPKGYFHRDNYKLSLQNAINFGGASTAASAIHRQLSTLFRGHMPTDAHNLLSALILKTTKADRERLLGRYPRDIPSQRTIPNFAGISAAKALLKLKLGRAMAHLTPTVTRLRKADGTATYRITGLPDIAARMLKGKPKDMTRELRIRLSLVHVADTVRNPEGYRNRLDPGLLPQPDPSLWFDAALLYETPSPLGEGRGGAYHIDIPAPEIPELQDIQTGDHIVTLLSIEWRDRKGRRTPTDLKAHTAIIPLEAIPLHPDERQSRPRPRRFRTKSTFSKLRPAYRPHKPTLTPRQRLTAALSPIKRE